MTIEKRLWRMGTAVTLLLVLLSLRLLYWQLVRGPGLPPVAVNLSSALAAGGLAGSSSETAPLDRLETLPQPVIQRTWAILSEISRGSIYDRNGVLLAYDRLDVEGNATRFYSEPSLAHTLGYVSEFRTGVAGLERSYNEALLGINRLDTQIGSLIHQPITGSDLVLSVDISLQREAERLLGSNSGAIVVLDGESGAVLALASAPRFDPNRILEDGYAQGLMLACQATAGCQAPFLNRTTQGLYPPGSTWKTVTLIAALDTGQVSPQTVFDFGQQYSGENGPYYVYEVDGFQIIDPNHSEGRLALDMSYAKSSNAAFARMGDEMLPATFLDYASRLGFGKPGEITSPFDIETAASQVANDPDTLYENDVLRSVTAIGQGEVLATPLQMSMVVLAVLNGGDLPVPYLVEGIRSPSGRIDDSPPNRRVLRNLMKTDTAELVKEMMVTVVESGSGGQARIPGVVTGGKTGTAQVGENLPPHAWFTGFAEHENRSVVITVLVEHGGQGSQVAAPLFVQIAEAALALPERQPVEEVVPQPTDTPPPQPTAAEPEITQAAPGSTQAAPESTQAAPEVSLPTPPLPTATPTLAAGFPPPPELLRDPEKKDIADGEAACPGEFDGPIGTGELIWPSQYGAISGTPFQEGHPGVDLSAPPGSPVYAADTGRVIFAGWTDLGYGNAVLIDHGNGLRTLYAHLSWVSTHCGEAVEKGQIIGQSGSTGNSSGPHLHFEVRVPGGYVNPISLLPAP